jgi:hypothetical protein
MHKNSSTENHNLKTDKESKVAVVFIRLPYDRNNRTAIATANFQNLRKLFTRNQLREFLQQIPSLLHLKNITHFFKIEKMNPNSIEKKIVSKDLEEFASGMAKMEPFPCF